MVVCSSSKRMTECGCTKPPSVPPTLLKRYRAWRLQLLSRLRSVPLVLGDQLTLGAINLLVKSPVCSVTLSGLHLRMPSAKWQGRFLSTQLIPAFMCFLVAPDRLFSHAHWVRKVAVAQLQIVVSLCTISKCKYNYRPRTLPS